MLTNERSEMRFDTFKILSQDNTAADDTLTRYEIEPTPAQLEVIDYLDGLNLNYIANSEFAHLNLRPYLRQIYDQAKRTCNQSRLPNARLTLLECLAGFMALLWESADTFAGLAPDARLAYALELTTKVSNKANRRPTETQLPEYTSDLDVRVPSCTRNPLELDVESRNFGQRVYHSKPESVSHIQGRPDWVKANKYENDLIADVDGSRAATPESESEFERCERLLGADEADWYWSVKANRDLFPQRHPERCTLTAVGRKRFQRLKHILGRTSQLSAYRGRRFLKTRSANVAASRTRSPTRR
jgi:hypothetical protein